MTTRLKTQAIRVISVFLVCISLIAQSTPAFGAAVWQKEDAVDYTLAELRQKDFSGQDISGTSFAGADLRESDLQKANLSGSILTKASFVEANLNGADLTEVFGDRVDFTGADLTNTVFVDSILTSSLFSDSNITGADFSGAMIDRFQVEELCQIAEGTNPHTGTETRDSLGC